MQCRVGGRSEAVPVMEWYRTGSAGELLLSSSGTV